MAANQRIHPTMNHKHEGVSSVATHHPHEASYSRELGDGLLLRWSTKADTEAIAQLYSYVFRDKPDWPLNHYIHNWTSDLMSGRHPLCGPNEFALVEDTRQREIVAATGLMSLTVAYEDIRFAVGRPEIVASHPEYRNRGLIRAVFELIHARSAARGDLAQGITGIPYYYRQFGYEYALDLGGGRTVPLTAIAKAKEDEAETYTLRPAPIDDLPRIAALYEREQRHASIATVADRSYWRWMFEGQRDEAGEGWKPQMIVDASGQTAGYVLPRRLRWGERLGISGLAVEPDVSLAAALPGVLRGLQAYALAAASWISDKEPPPANALYFHLGASHPVYDLLASALVSRVHSPYAWYVRVPDLPAFVRHAAPVLERRLAGSSLANYSGELKCDFYRGGLRLAFEDGRLAAAEDWRAQVWGERGNAGFPPLVFLQLLFGRRSYAELRQAYDDVWANDETEPLVEALFPPRTAYVLPLD
jgi:hypothetical protein